MRERIRPILLLLVVLNGLTTASVLAQELSPYSLEVSPGIVYRSAGESSCFTVTVPGASNRTLDVGVLTPWGEAIMLWGWPGLDENGQAYSCVGEDYPAGEYVFIGMRFTEHTWSELVPLWTPLTIEEPPVFPPPIIYGLGPGCDNWDCIWVGGRNFEPYSRLIVASANWGYQETYYGPAWQTWPPLNVSEDGWWLSLQIVDANLRSAFGGDGVYVLVLNSDGNASSWAWVQSLPPTIASATPSCADFYCITFTGSFPQNAYVDFRIPGTSEVLPNAYSDLVVTSTQITLRLNPSARSVFDTSGLNAWVVNPALANWSSLYYLPPVDRSVIGWFSGVSHQGANHYLYGWACAKTFPGSIDLHVYVGGPAGGGGTFAFSGPANQPSEPAVAEACTSSGSNYRFWVQIPPSVVQQHMGSPIYVYGISPFGYSNLPLNGSGSFSVPGVLSLNRREYIYFGDRLLAVDAP